MKFHLENIGCIEKADIELGNLTIICGHNNTGKTYVTYSIYGFFKNFFDSVYINLDAKLSKGMTDIQISEKNLEDIVIQLNESCVDRLSDIFSANPDEFAESKFKVDINTIKNLNLEIINPFIITAERIGIQLLQKELDENRSDLITMLTKTSTSNLKKGSILELLKNKIARFALPIDDSISFSRMSDYLIKLNSFLKEEKPELITYIEEMLDVRYEVVNGQKIVTDKNSNKTIPYYMASTSVRSLFDLHLWLKHQARKDDILFIDEPELNLHPANQRKMARLFVRLIKAGIKVFVTTHSDYIIKELNNLIILGHQFEDRESIMKKYKYTEEDVLDKSQVKVYIAEKNTLTPASIDETGIEISNFDTEIDEMNDFYDDVLFATGK